MTNMTKICDFIGDYIIHNYNYNNQMSFKVNWNILNVSV